MGGDSVNEVSDRTIDLVAEENENEKNGAEKEVCGKGDVEGMMEDSIDEKKTETEEQKMDIDEEENRQGKESMEQEIGKSREEVSEGIDEMKIEASEVLGKVKLNKQKPQSVRAGAKHGHDEVEFNEENGDKIKDMKMWFDRPIRQRKIVERLVLCVENKADKEFQIEKGPGTKLKDIPNVAYKLSRKKNENALKLLHSILFSRRGKAAEIKNHVLRFSGFMRHDNEEKEKNKVREKLDKCFKEKLLGLCNTLDITVSNLKARKEDIIVKLMEFLEAPHATTSELVSDKEQSSEGKKRKMHSKSSTSAPGGALSEQSFKKVKRIAIVPRKRKMPMRAAELQDEFEEVEEKDKAEDNAENGNGLLEKSSDEKFEQAESKEKENKSEGESEEEKRKPKSVSRNTPSKPSSGTKSTRSKGKRDAAGSILKVSLKKNTEADKPQPPALKMYSRKETAGTNAGKEVDKQKSEKSDKGKSKPAEETPNPSEADTPLPITAKKTSNKEITGSDEEKSKPAEKTPNPSEADTPLPITAKKLSNKETTVDKGSDEEKSKPAEMTPYPSDRDIQVEICQIIQQVDINQATFGDIIRTIGKKFNMDPTPRKPSIKLMIQDQLSKLGYDNDDDDDDE